jgi:hypothetical protein
MKRKKEKSNRSNTRNNKNNNIKNKKKIKIDFNGRLYQPKKNYNITEIPNKKENKFRKIIKNTIIIKKNKSSKVMNQLKNEKKLIIKK